MIKLIGEPGKPGAKLQMIPRSPFRGYPTLDLPLYYGHVCPFCGNVIQAVFKTDKEIDLFPYEETLIYNRKGEFKYQIPAAGQDARQGPDMDTFYRSSLLKAGPWKAQRIYLLHHVLPYWGIDHFDIEKNSGWFETTSSGDRVCPYTGISSIREDLIPKDLVLFSRAPIETLDTIAPAHLPRILGELRTRNTNSLEGRYVRAIGSGGGPMLLIDRTSILKGFGYEVKNLVAKIVAEKAAGEEANVGAVA